MISERAGALNETVILQKTLQDLERSISVLPSATIEVEEIDDTAINDNSTTDALALFATKPFCTYRGHTADVLDLSWSKVHCYIHYDWFDNDLII